MNCVKCGKEIPEGTKICSECAAGLFAQRKAPEIPPVSTGDWFVTLLLACIPLVGFIMLFVWAFGGGANPSKRNWARASLIWMLIGIVPLVILGVVVFAGAAGMRGF